MNSDYAMESSRLFNDARPVARSRECGLESERFIESSKRRFNRLLHMQLKGQRQNTRRWSSS